MNLNQILDCFVPSRFPKKDYQSPTEREAKQHAKNLLRRLEKEKIRNENIPYQTYAGRNQHSQSVIETLVNPGSIVLEVGIGNNDAPTFRELLQSGQEHNYEVRGLELNPALIPRDLKLRVQKGNIACPNKKTQELVQQADIIHISNLLAPGFRSLEQADKQETIRGLAENMKENAQLLITHASFIGTTEEGFWYEKRKNSLSLKIFVYSVEASKGALYYGGHSFNSVFEDTTLQQMFVYGQIYTNKKLEAFLKNEYFKEKSDMDDMTITNRIRDAIAQGFKTQGLANIERKGDMFAVPIHFILDYAARKSQEE